MRIATVLGTRPEIIRLARIIPKLDALCEHVLLHPGQNYDYRLNEIFFDQLSIRRPDVFLEVKGATFAEQVAQILARSEAAFRERRPDRLLILGDTNSALGAFVAKRMGIPVYHMEAGNRCYDDRVPEEVNRRVIDHSSDVLMPYSQLSRENLLAEGIPGRRVHVIGNPIAEVLEHYSPLVAASRILETLGLSPRSFFLVTMHRQENVDDPSRLRALVASLGRVRAEYRHPVVVSVHPRTKKRMQEFGLEVDDKDVRLIEPLGLPDFVKLEKSAFCVLSDSGTVQEECCIFKVPNVTIRDTTERPETIACGSNVLSGVEPDVVLRCVKVVTAEPARWTVPPEYVVPDVSTTVTKIVLGR